MGCPAIGEIRSNGSGKTNVEKTEESGSLKSMTPGDNVKSKRFFATSAAALAVVAMSSGEAQANELENMVKIGFARVGFNIQSEELTGPPGTTPPGIGIDVRNLNILAMSYERRLSSNWAVQFQGGIPPKLTIVGAGAAQSAGTVANARIWFPTVLALYTFTGVPVIRPYVGVGATYTFFTRERASPAYTAAVMGSSSSLSMKASWGPYVRLGFEYPIDNHWSLNMEYSTFRFKTTATIATPTPGIGDITRRIDVKDSPRILGVTVGYRF
jgi:outer membrane protein